MLKLADASCTATVDNRVRYTPEQRAQALELVEAGASWAQTGAAVGAHKQTVGVWVKRQRAHAAA